MNTDIFDYFNNTTEYPTILNDDILPYNELWSDVSPLFLEAFINHCHSHLLCYSLDYYLTEEEKLFNLNKIHTNEFTSTHARISQLNDDVVIISKIKNGYMFFWYHFSGRCDIGRFTTTDTIELIEQNLINWLENMKCENITGYRKLEVSHFLKGYIRF